MNEADFGRGLAEVAETATTWSDGGLTALRKRDRAGTVEPFITRLPAVGRHLPNAQNGCVAVLI